MIQIGTIQVPARCAVAIITEARKRGVSVSVVAGEFDRLREWVGV